MVFNETAIVSNELLTDAGLEALIGLSVIAILLVVALIVLAVVGVYVYTSFAYMRLAEKNKQKHPGLAWIPFVGKPLISSKAAKMHWWPILLLLFFAVPVFGFLCLIIFSVFDIIWNWNLMKAVKRPGWWALFMLINPVYWVLLGVAAWGKKKK